MINDQSAINETDINQKQQPIDIKSERKFLLNIERVDHANSQDNIPTPMVLDDQSGRNASQEAEPRIDSK